MSYYEFEDGSTARIDAGDTGPFVQMRDAGSVTVVRGFESLAEARTFVEVADFDPGSKGSPNDFEALVGRSLTWTVETTKEA